MNGTIESTTTDWRGDTLTASAALGRTVFITTTNASKAITAPPGAFSALDVGRSVTGTGVPAGATIAAVASDTSATLSANATATGSTTVTLGAAVLLFVGDTADFDEDGGWLVIADSAPLEYLTVDEDAATVTLATPVLASYAAGEPVNVWDPTVPGGGAKVVEYVASVMTDRGAVPATIPHGLVPLAGIESLDGASVALAEGDDGEWYVDQVLGREPNIDPAKIGSDLFKAYLAADGGRTGGLNIPTNADTTISDWTVTSYDPDAFTYDGAGRLTLRTPGSYLSVVTVTWVSNTSNRRETVMTTTTLGVDNEEVRIVVTPDSTTGTAAHQVTLLQRTTDPNVQLRALAFQTTGASLALNGNPAGTRTNWRVLRLR